jgi:hypothetical protein
VAKAKKKKEHPYENAAHILIAALKVAPPALHPPKPFHFGGPQPKVDAESYVHTGLWIAGLAKPYVDPEDRKAFDDWVRLAKLQLELGAGETSQRAKLFEADAGKVKRVPLKIGVWAAHEASNWAFRPIYAGGAARVAASNFVKLLLKLGKDAEVSTFLRNLDRVALYMESEAMMRNRKIVQKEKAVRTLWRGSTDGRASHWVMERADGTFALLAKMGPRWVLTEGRRDDVLATVDDKQFEEAAQVVLAATATT